MANDAKIFQGTGVAVVTPFRNYQVDFASLERVLDHVLAGGVDYVVSLGSTGEAMTLSEQEKREVLDFTINHISGRVPLVAGNFGSSNTAALCSYIEDFDFRRIDAILSSSPSYNKPSQEGIYLHYKSIARTSPVPVIMYNVPGRTASNMEASTTCRIARDCQGIIGIKEASGERSQWKEIIEDRPDGFLAISGDDPTALQMTQDGGNGVISVIANALPDEFSRMIAQALKSDIESAKELDDLTQPLHAHLYKEGNPSGIKAALSLMSICSPEVRLPLTAMTSKGVEGLKAAFAAISSP